MRSAPFVRSATCVFQNSPRTRPSRGGHSAGHYSRRPCKRIPIPLPWEAGRCAWGPGRSIGRGRPGYRPTKRSRLEDPALEMAGRGAYRDPLRSEANNGWTDMRVADHSLPLGLRHLEFADLEVMIDAYAMRGTFVGNRARSSHDELASAEPHHPGSPEER